MPANNSQKSTEWLRNFPPTPPMPLLFLGHGNPMNAIEENEFVQGFREIASTLPQPQAILCISAHWETEGTKVTGAAHPDTLHDFGGFPQELYAQTYPAPGHPLLAEALQRMNPEITADNTRGFDHGVWTTLKHLYPKANVPTVQLSLDYNKTTQGHYDFAKSLGTLRKSGILIVGSGNLIHNLSAIDWRNPNNAFHWATKASTRLKEAILKNQHKELINYLAMGEEMRLAIPSPDHFLPLLYILALKEREEEICIFNDKVVMGSLSMTSIKIG